MDEAAGRLDDRIDDFLNKTQAIGPAFGDAEPIGMLLGASYAGAGARDHAPRFPGHPAVGARPPVA